MCAFGTGARLRRDVGPYCGADRSGVVEMSDYATFLAEKAQVGSRDGFQPTFLPSALLDFQPSLVEWNVNIVRCAIFAYCGIGKTLKQLVWAQNVVRHSNRPVLIMAPLAVTQQTL